ncbi:hypothetical protein PybrP1_008846 [[Pythium] brassicae (nom. inval.)]|nr:hypothetical protein PybrP1_008846 [[Pythium] brassicae (nom. inval.)]
MMEEEHTQSESTLLERVALASDKKRSDFARRHSDETPLPWQFMEATTKGLQPGEELNLHHLTVLRKHRIPQKPRGRGSTGMLAKLDVQATLAGSPGAGGGAEEAKHKKRYEEMMNRFQIRRLQSPELSKEDTFSSQRKLRRGSRSAVVSIGRRELLQVPTALAARGMATEATKRQSAIRSGSKAGGQIGSLLDTRAAVIDMSIAATTSGQSAAESLGSRGDADAATTMCEKLEKLYEDNTAWRWMAIASSRKAASKWRRMLRRLKQPMSPLSALFRIRMAVLGGALFAYVVSFPLHLAFHEAEQQWTQSIDYAVEFIGLADFLLMFNTSFVDAQNELVTSRRAIAVRYMTGWGLLDIFSSLPIHAARNYFSGTRVRWTDPSVLVVDIVPRIARIARIAHFVAILRFMWDARPNRTGKSVWDWLLYSRYSHLLRIGVVVGCILITAHYMACIWKTLAYAEQSVPPHSLYERATRPLRKKHASRLSDFADFMGATLHPTSSAVDSSESEADSASDIDEDYREKPRKSKAKRSIYRTENFDPDESPQRSARAAAKCVKKLSRGQAFGEVALLVNYPRTANVRAITYVEMCVLSRSDFHQNLARHPEDRSLVVLRMLTSAMERNESNGVPCPLMEVVRDVYGAGDPAKSEAITPAYAAELITRILITELEDESIRYGITSKLMEQLVEYRDRVLDEKKPVEPARSPARVSRTNSHRESGAGLARRKSSTRALEASERPQVPPPALLARIESIEETQEQLMRCVVEMRGFITEMLSEQVAEAAGTAPRVEPERS